MANERFSTACRIPILVAMTDKTDTRPVAKCPICAKPAVDEFRPFCSKRCRDVDLNRWLSGNYVVAGKEEEDEDGLGGERKLEDGRG
jgi:endogenous inhibitor of DNA gyrase (YacG/DUF329 family)